MQVALHLCTCSCLHSDHKEPLMIVEGRSKLIDLLAQVILTRRLWDFNVSVCVILESLL